MTLKVKVQLSWHVPLNWLRIRLSQYNIAGLSEGSGSCSSSSTDSMCTNLYGHRNLPIQANLKKLYNCRDLPIMANFKNLYNCRNFDLTPKLKHFL